MYFRDRRFRRNQDMYLEAGFSMSECSISRMDIGQIDPLALVLFPYQKQLGDSEGSCTLVIAPAVAGMLEDARDVFEIV
jgi:hypothetical protein